MDLCWQTDVSAFEYAVEVGHNFPSKEQASFNFMAEITVCSDFGARKIKSVTVSTVSPPIFHYAKWNKWEKNKYHEVSLMCKYKNASKQVSKIF